MSDVVLMVDGVRFEGWKEFSIERSIEQAAGAFRLVATERYPNSPKSWRLENGMACKLLIDGQQAIEGFVDTTDRAFDSSSRSVDLAGRDRTADLVDCCADPVEYRNQTLDALARKLAAPYGIDVVVTPGTKVGAAFARWAVEPGETIWDCIERAARQRALLVITDGKGRLLITRPGVERFGGSLVEGVNVLSATFHADSSSRYHYYKALGQSNDERWDNAASAAHLNAEVTDPSVRKPRKLVFSAEDLADGVTVQQRAVWERNVRRGRGMQISVTVQGLVDPRAGLWQPNQMIPVQLPSFGIDQELLIVGTAAQRGDDTKTEIRLAPRSAFELLPEKPDEQGTITPWGDS